MLYDTASIVHLQIEVLGRTFSYALINDVPVDIRPLCLNHWDWPIDISLLWLNHWTTPAVSVLEMNFTGVAPTEKCLEMPWRCVVYGGAVATLHCWI